MSQDSDAASPSPAAAVTAMLVAASAGDRAARERLFTAVYDELKRIARHHMRGQREGVTLQTTALVHETYVRLVQPSAEGSIRDRVHFFSLASRAMRQILIDHARARASQKRGGDARRLSLDEALTAAPADAPAAELLDLDRALERLERHSERLGRVVEMRFFGGMSFPEIATELERSESTVKRDWRLARAFIYKELAQPEQTSAAKHL